MKKILVAEDDKFLVSAYKLKLTKAGFEVEVARDGQEATEKLHEFIPDLILLDLIMPIKDGFAVLAEIKSDDKWKKIPVIITSNLDQKTDINRGLELGAKDYMVKSDMTLDALISRINSFIG